MTRDEKMTRLLKMQEHPEHYTEDEIRQLMADDECRLLYEQMVRGTDALFFEKNLTDSSQTTQTTIPDGCSDRSVPLSFNSARKIAAIFIGVLMLSGFAYAAVHIWISPSSSKEKSGQTEITAKPSTPSATQKEVGDTIPQKQRIFENTELMTILSEISSYYDYKVVYKSETAKHVRLYFTWDMTKQIEDVIMTFNQFERIHITREDNELIVEY